MALPKPLAPPYDIREWQKRPFHERVKMVCQAWAVQGYGTPWPIYVVYLLKVCFYLGVWCWFCSFTPGLGSPRTILQWWTAPEAFQKAILWSIAFEGLGLGCGSGPLTGRYLPPFGGALYFLRPGTTKMPLFPGVPLIGSDRRTYFDVLLYLANYGFLFRALSSPSVTSAMVLPIICLLVVLGITDKTIFLASRGEHYVSALVCFLFPHDWLAGSKLVWMAVWLWAATSKLNHHFSYVVTVMQSNSPLTAFGPLRKLLYRNYPEDLRPSTLASVMGHGGTVTEFLFPCLLLVGHGGTFTTVVLIVMLGFHIFITSSVPMGVPIEWNFLMVYGAFFLFGHHARIHVASIDSPILLAYLFVACFLVQVIGNVFPAKISFLWSMRYYAGNWAYSIWLFKGESSKKLDTHLIKSAPRVQDQLAKLYDQDTIVSLMSKVTAFRAMHLHGRALHTLLPRAVSDIDAYEYLDGEIVAGVVLGWNFGDGHLHNLQLLQSIQRQCQFEEGELRCIFVEAEPVGKSTLAWAIADAKTGVRERGSLDTRPMRELQPWPQDPTLN